jgi:hypothetical protein
MSGMPIIYAGNAPFCGEDKYMCDEYPGYEETGRDKKGDGSKCLTGSKAVCKFNVQKWLNSPEYLNLPPEIKAVVGNNPQFVVHGTAPFCGASECDVWKSNAIPLKAIKYGGGAKCATGDKWIGLKVPNPAQFQYIQDAIEHCKKMEQLNKEAIIAGFNSVGNVAKTIGSFAAPSAGVFASLGNAAPSIASEIGKAAPSIGSGIFASLKAAAPGLLKAAAPKLLDMVNSSLDKDKSQGKSGLLTQGKALLSNLGANLVK